VFAYNEVHGHFCQDEEELKKHFNRYYYAANYENGFPKKIEVIDSSRKHEV